MKHSIEANPTRQPSGYVCPAPFFYEARGEVCSRSCGKCKRCLAASERDLAARAAAEAVTSDQVIFFTLTYADGEPGAFQWLSGDRRAFIRALRDQFHEQARQFVGAPVRYGKKCDLEGIPWKDRIAAVRRRVRFFGCGEAGSHGTRRNHYHTLCFVSASPVPFEWQSTPRQKNGKEGREHISIWRHGFVNVQVLPHLQSARVKAARYCAKYLKKTSGLTDSGGFVRPSAVFYRSTKPALGTDYLHRRAGEIAEAGLPLPSFFEVPGVSYSRGVRAGQPTKNYLSGVARREWIEGYKAAWLAKHGPDKRLPHSDFIARFDPDYIAPYMENRDWQASAKRALNKAARDRTAGALPRKTVPPARTDMAAFLHVSVAGETLGLVEMLPNGVFIWQPSFGLNVVVEKAGFAAIMPDNPDVCEKVDSWIERRRAPVDPRSPTEVARGVPFKAEPWLSPRDRFELYEDIRTERVAALLRFAKAKPRKAKANEPEMIPLLGLERRLRMASICYGTKTREAKYGTIDLMIPLLNGDGIPNRRTYREPDPDKLLRRSGAFASSGPPPKRPVNLFKPKGSLSWPDKPRWMKEA